MSRAVTADHVLFDECISAFRRPNGTNHIIKGESCSYLITGFELRERWELGYGTVHPSIRVILPGAYSSFISKINNPSWVGTHNSHRFGIALASIISFITGKSCQSTRDDYLCRREDLTESEKHQLALRNPILTAGPGSTQTSLAKETENEYKNSVVELIKKLHSIDYKNYKVTMQAIRLVHLSTMNKRDDFGLGYLLVVSAIESVAQKAIKREKVRVKNPSEKAWKQRAEIDTEFSELFKAYLSERGKQDYLKERYIEYILKYAPADCWGECVPHPMQELAEYVKEISPSHDIDYIVQKHWFEKYPNELSGEELRTILADSFTHRSCFIHRGEQPPHTDPQSFNRFFQEYHEYDGYHVIERILPNYELLLGISRKSILNWLSTK